MGYTHYLENVTNDITNKDWRNIVTFVNALYKHAEDSDVALTTVEQNDEGEWLDVPVTYLPPHVDEIIFNGKDEDSHETCSISRFGNSNYDFCKTARKPYDPYVVAFYLYLDSIGVGKFTSDGYAEELSDGRQLCASIKHTWGI